MTREKGALTNRKAQRPCCGIFRLSQLPKEK